MVDMMVVDSLVAYGVSIDMLSSSDGGVLCLSCVLFALPRSAVDSGEIGAASRLRPERAEQHGIGGILVMEMGNDLDVVLISGIDQHWSG